MQAEPAGLFVADRDEEAQPGCSGTLSSQRRPRLVRNCARGAGTHNPWRSRFQNLRCNLVAESKVLGVWVPACAGTTHRAAGAGDLDPIQVYLIVTVILSETIGGLNG